MESGRTPPDVARLREYFSYDPDTGVVRRRIGRASWTGAGEEAGSMRGEYRMVGLRLDGERYGMYTHRLAWALHHGRWPENEIDHVNGVKSDNRLANLREASRSENQRNVGKKRSATSRLKGASYHTTHRLWRARIRHGGSSLHLGWFRTEEAAHAAYAKVARELHGDFMRLK
jgi:hypothetical protein